MNTKELFAAIFWMIRIRKQVTQVIVRQKPNETSETPSRIFWVGYK
jgi:hypothetical protein